MSNMTIFYITNYWPTEFWIYEFKQVQVVPFVNLKIIIYLDDNIFTKEKIF